MPFGGGLVVEPGVAQVHWLRASVASSWFLWWVGVSGGWGGSFLIVMRRDDAPPPKKKINK